MAKQVDDPFRYEVVCVSSPVSLSVDRRHESLVSCTTAPVLGWAQSPGEARLVA